MEKQPDICHQYFRGHCYRGASCNFAHVKPGTYIFIIYTKHVIIHVYIMKHSHEKMLQGHLKPNDGIFKTATYSNNKRK